MKAKVTKIENGLVYAKSDNPLGESRPLAHEYPIPLIGKIGPIAKKYFEDCDKWQAAESERTELQILEQSILDGHIPFIGKEVEVKQEGKYFKII